MSLRLLLVLAALLTGSCTNAPNKKPAIDEIDRHHTEQMQRMGGSSGGGSM